MKGDKPVQEPGDVFFDPVKIQRAMELAFEDAIEEHRGTGVPMVFWKDGKVVHMTAEEVIEYRKNLPKTNGSAPKSE